MGSLVAPRHSTQGGGLHERSKDGSPWHIVGLRTTGKVPCNLGAGHPTTTTWWVWPCGGDDIVAEPRTCASRLGGSSDWISEYPWEPCGRLAATRSACGPYRPQREDTFSFDMRFRCTVASTVRC